MKTDSIFPYMRIWYMLTVMAMLVVIDPHHPIMESRRKD
jgi:hypothetical protein